MLQQDGQAGGAEVQIMLKSSHAGLSLTSGSPGSSAEVSAPTAREGCMVTSLAGAAFV
jgi:hypothetical protein